jgi:EAL and modified HD-GYP domain-containing signal transduction protein
MAYIGRQPIFDARRRVFAYELLYRADEQAIAAVFDDPDAATETVLLESVVGFGLDALAENGLAFVNITRDALLDGHYRVLPHQTVVLELLEDVVIDVAFVDAVRRARAEGYRFALDDYTPDVAGLLAFADYVKVDVLEHSRAELAELLAGVRRAAPTVRLVAEKVESYEAFDVCRELGFERFQGFFFQRPQTLERRTVGPDRSAALELLAELARPDTMLDDLETIINREPILSYRFLRLLNSGHYALPARVESVRHALVMLGLNNARQLATLLAITNGGGIAAELATSALMRAHMADQLVAPDPRLRPGAFTTGLLSILDAVLDAPLDELLAQLPVSDEIKRALLEGAGPLGAVLRAIVAYERGDLAGLDATGLSREQLRTTYLSAARWATSLRTTACAAA